MGKLGVSVNSKVIFVLGAVCVLLGACSEDKCPPDDNSAPTAQKLQPASTSCLARADEFHVCALAALESFALTDNERTSLSTCSYQQAIADGSSSETFSDARAAVSARCASF